MTFKNLSLVCLSLALALTGCNNDVKLEPLPEPPTITSFKASMARVARGTMITLDWDTRDAVTVEINQVGVGPVAGVDNKAFGSAPVTVNADALFVLSAINKRGVKATAPISVGVEGSATAASFAALPGLIPAGTAATLVWSAPGAKVITITPVGGAAIDLKGQGDLGSIEVKPAATTVYTLNADGTQKSATVSVAQALTQFTVSKTLALPGEMVTLAWKTSGASKVIVSTPGKPPLVSETDSAKMADGSVSATLPNAPLGTVVPFMISVEGAASALSETVTVVLSNQPEIKTFTGPLYAKTGQKFTLAWTTTNADLVELSAGGIVFWTSTAAPQATAGTLQLETPAAATEYTLTAKSALGGAAVTRLLTVSPIASTTITTFTATPSTVATGGTAVTLSWTAPNARRLKITGSDGHTVATARGVAAETGTATAFPNGAVTYTLDADNTLDPAITATQAVTVTTPAQFGPGTTGAVFAGNPVSLDWTIGAGAQLFGYPHTDVVATPASTGFVDISTTGARLAFTATADDATQTFTPPDFESFLYGNRVSGPVTVSTNGFFVFASTAATRSATVAIPNTTIERNFIAPFWTNLELASVGQIFWQVLNEAPERTLVVQFNKVKVKGDATSELTFEAKVHQTGGVSFEYKKLSATALPASVSGVQGAIDGLAVAGAADNVGIQLFGPKPAPIMATFNAPGSAGGFIKLAGGYLKAAYTPSPFVASGALAITEVMYQPSPAIATTGEWFEVVNSTALPLDLNGWTIDFGGGATHVLTTATVVPPNGSLLLGQSASGPLNDDVATGYVYGTTFSLAEPVGSVQLRLLNYAAVSSWDSSKPDNGGAGVSVGVDTSLYLKSTDTSTTPPHPLSCSSTVTFGSQTPLQKGSPGTLAGCFGYRMAPIPVSYLDISATGAVTTTGDSVVVSLDLTAAPFTFFGAAQSSVAVSTNGFLRFKATTDSGTSNRTVPSTSTTGGATAAIFWDDLDSGSSGPSSVYSKRIAANEDPNNPGAHWVVQWHHYEHWLAGDDLNFQVKLFDTGVIEYHYATMISGSTSNYGNGNSATVWIENVAGNTALISSVNKPLVLPNTALRFTPN